MKVLKIALATTLAVGLVAGMTLPALATSDNPAPQAGLKPRPRILKGKVVNINQTEELFTIQVGERSVDIKVNEDTRYFKLTVPLRRLLTLRQHRTALVQPEGMEATAPPMPMKLRAIEQASSLRRGKAFIRPALMSVGSQELAPNLLHLGEGKEKPKRPQGNIKWLRWFGEEATFGDIVSGDRVIVGVVPREGEPLAKLVLIIKPATYKRVIGEVTEITGDTITITPEEGDVVILNYNGDTLFILRGTPYLLEEDEEAMAIYMETNDGPLAKKIIQGWRHPEPAD